MPVKKACNHARRVWRKRWLVKRDRGSFISRSRSQKRRAFEPKRWLPLNEHTKRSFAVGEDRRLIIRLPERLDFEENYETTVSHFKVLREATLTARRVKKLLFNDIRYISPSAALVLASEVDRWNQRAGGKLKAEVDMWDEDIARLLCQMGYFDLLNIPYNKDVSVSKDLTFLRFKRGDREDRDSGKLAKQLRVEIEQLVGFGVKKHFLFEGLSEAITNVGQHAYPQADGRRPCQWWVSASYEKMTRELRVMFYDQGVGIPGTLQKSEFFEFMREFFHRWLDSQKIEAAMEIGRSASGRSERGKGLQNLIEFAKSHREGLLSIYSLRGMYRIISTRDGARPATTTHRRDHENSIGGTLIEWAVKL